MEKTYNPINFYWNGVDVDYHSRYDCANSYCDEEGICRCGTIVDTNVCSVNYEKIAEVLTPVLNCAGNKEVFRYCVERAVRHNIRIADFEVETEGGYYGDEIEGVYLDIDKEVEIINMIHTLSGMESNEEMIEFALKEEYGSYLSKFKGCKWTLEKMPVKDIRIGNKKHYSDLNKDYVKSYKGWTGVVCLVDSKNRIVDGHHRLKSKEKLEEVKILRSFFE